jgi:hypothetical protein
MAQPYIVINRHAPEDCEPMDAGIEKIGPHLKGRYFFCTCTFGEHAFYMILEGNSSESVISGLPPEWRPWTRAVPLEIFKLPN